MELIMKKILLIMSAYTGHGHKSISDALMEQFSAMPGLEVRVLDGFELMGDLGLQMSKMYGPMTRYARHVWEASYNLSNRSAAVPESMVATASARRFLQILEEFEPDLILSVHALFNGSILRLLETAGKQIPLVVLQADIISIHQTWCEPGAYRTICPTQEAYECSLRNGMPPEKLVRMSFPTRKRFTDLARTAPTPDYDGTRPLHCLLMSGGEGSGSLKRYTQVLMEETDACLTVICGRNEKLRESLNEAFLPQYEGRLQVLGFVTEVEQVMAANDLLIARGSPNSLMEGVVMNLPLIITGALPGQERDNPPMMANHDLGVLCSQPEDLPGLLRLLTEDNCKRYKAIRAAQRAYRNLDSAHEVAAYIAGLIPAEK